jgi:hypothetical protein
VPDFGQCRDRPGPPDRSARGYTRTLHHAGHLRPGDLWCAVAGEHPHTAILVHRRHDRITLTDQYGATFAYPAAAVIPTAVPDALPLRDRTRPGR